MVLGTQCLRKPRAYPFLLGIDNRRDGNVVGEPRGLGVV